MTFLLKFIAGFLLFPSIIWLIQVEFSYAFTNEVEIKYYNQVQQAIEKGILPPQEQSLLAEKSPVMNPIFDLTLAQKEALTRYKKKYPRTKALVRCAEGIKCKPDLIVYPDKKGNAIGYGDTIFLKKNPHVTQITSDVAEWLMHEHLRDRVITPFQKGEFYKKWGKKVGEDYLANVYSKIYNVGFNAFMYKKDSKTGKYTKEYTRQYKLMLQDPFKNKAAIEKEWLTWENKNRRKQEITAMHQDPIFKTNLASQEKPKKHALNDFFDNIRL